jgi:hypothetical protein
MVRVKLRLVIFDTTRKFDTKLYGLGLSKTVSGHKEVDPFITFINVSCSDFVS